MILDLSRKPKVTVEHSDAGILVTLPGTGFSVIYVKTDGNKLIASAFSSSVRTNSGCSACVSSRPPAWTLPTSE